LQIDEALRLGVARGAKDLVALGQQQACQQGAILTGNAEDQCAHGAQFA